MHLASLGAQPRAGGLTWTEMPPGIVVVAPQSLILLTILVFSNARRRIRQVAQRPDGSPQHMSLLRSSVMSALTQRGHMRYAQAAMCDFAHGLYANAAVAGLHRQSTATAPVLAYVWRC
jgi:hypothetical protein